ncbi:MAG TPA: hypothetical protein ENH23_07415 [candidate division Zixibacteria bacterium]|nr:hypothetical protein [candidate division Zixibacteria bacterium]
MKELKISIVLKLLTDSRKHLSDLRSSVGPVTLESLDKLENYLKDFDEEVETVSQKKRIIRRAVVVLSLGLLLALDRLLSELVPQAVTLISQIFIK